MSRRYISGPMSGLPDLNFPAFHAAAADLRSRGVDVVNPAELNTDPGKSWQECLRVDIKALCDCDAIVMLPGWTRSKGANLEFQVAQGLGLEVEFYVPQDARLPSPLFEEIDFGDDEFDDEWSCTHCGGEGYVEGRDVFWDECDEFGYGPCTSCRGTGERRHQWVF